MLPELLMMMLTRGRSQANLTTGSKVSVRPVDGRRSRRTDRR